MADLAAATTREGPPTETVGDAVRHLTKSFKDAGLDTPELDARILVCEAACLPRSVLVATPEHRLTPDQTRRMSVFASRRLAREPVSRILGRREFYGLDLELGTITLDPRPDTETVVDAVLELARTAPALDDLRLLDLGTGMGAILIALLCRLPRAIGVGTDIDDAALEVATRNARIHGVAARTRFLHSDWLKDVSGSFDIVVSNPPYIPSAQIAALEPEVARYDPRIALDGGADGLAAYRAITERAREALGHDGWLVLEVGAGQADAVFEICWSQGLEPCPLAPHIWNDLAGRPRCVAVKTRR